MHVCLLTIVAFNIALSSLIQIYVDTRYEGQSEITESWLISLDLSAGTALQGCSGWHFYIYRMNFRASLHIEVGVLSSLMCFY